MLHQWHKKGIQCWSSENASKEWNCAKAQNKFWRNIASSALMWRKKPIVDEALMFLRRLEDFSRSIKALLYEAWKEGKVFFSPKAQKRYVHKSFMHRKEMNYKTIHISHSKPMSTKYYKHSPANVTLIFPAMFLQYLLFFLQNFVCSFGQ